MHYDKEAHEVVQEALKNLREEAKAAKISYELPPEPHLDPIEKPRRKRLLSWKGLGFALFWLWVPALVLWMTYEPPAEIASAPAYAPRGITSSYAPRNIAPMCPPCPCRNPPLPSRNPSPR